MREGTNNALKPLGRPKVLAAATAKAAKEILAALGNMVDLVVANTFDDAERQLQNVSDLELVIVSYHFDELRPFRFVQLVRDDPTNAHIPVLLIRALPLHFGLPDLDSMKDAYKAIGVTDVLNLEDLTRSWGSTRAAEMFRHAISSILHRGGA